MGRMNILICEDEQIVAKDIQQTLEDAGYTVIGIAANCEEVLRLIDRVKPDLALMDLNLKSSESGVKVARMLREIHQIPSIMLTAYADVNTISEAKHARPLAYLLKPFHEKELVATIETSMHRYKEQKRVIVGLREDLSERSNSSLMVEVAEYEKDQLKARSNQVARDSIARVVSYLRKNISLATEAIEELGSEAGLDPSVVCRSQLAHVHLDEAHHFMAALEQLFDSRPLNRTTISVNDFITDLSRKFEVSCATEISFIESYSVQTPNILADVSTLEAAFMELFVNAHSAAPKVDTPIIWLTTTVLREEMPERFNPGASRGWFVEVRITDYGKGIVPEKLEKVMEPLFTEFGEDRKGLGLPSVEHVIQRHGGWMQLVSSKTDGTSVSVFLPLCDSPVEARHQAAQASEERSK